MANENTQDLAVLGFRVESNNAVNIINGVTQALKDLDAQAKITDAALEQKITAALANMAEAARSLGSSKATEGIHNFTSAIEELTKTKDFAGIIKGGVDALRSSGFETLAKNYGQALTSLSNVFTSTDNTIKGAVAGLQRSASGAIKDRDITSIRGYVNILEDAMAQLNLFIEKPKKIPEGVSKNDVEAARDNMKAMMIYVRQYMSAIENASEGENKKNHEARWSRDAQLAISEVTRTYNDFQKQYQTLLPGTLQTLKLHAVIDNIDEVMEKLHPSVDVKIDTASINSIGSLVASLEKLKTMDVSINVPTAAINSMRTQIMKAFENEPLQVPIAFTIGSKVVSRTVTAKDQGVAPVVHEIAEDAKKAGAETKKAKISIEGLEQDRKEFLDDLMSEVEEFDDLSKKWFPKGQDLLTPLFNEAMAGGEDQLKKLKGILTKIGYEKEGIQMFLDQTMPGYQQDDKEPPKIELPKVEPPKETETIVTEYETSFQNALEKLKGVASSYTSDLTHLITFHPSFLFTEEDERKSKEALQKLAGLLTSKKAEKLANAPMLGAVNLDAFKNSLSDAQEAYDALVAHIDLEENMPHLSFAKNTPGGGFMTQLNQAFDQLVAKPKNITVAPEHITVDRSDAVMKFAQNDIIMPVDDLTIAPSAIYIDNKALANIAKGSFENIVLPTDNVSLFPKTVSVVTTTAETIKADQNTIEAVIKSATLMPQAVKFDLSQAAKKDLLVKAKIKIAPTAATVDSEAAKQIVGTSKTAIKIQSKINIDPLPGDEIEKMGLLVTQINNVDVAYGQLLGTVRTLRDTVRETETAMSNELRGLIKGEQHKAAAKIKDPEKAAAADAEKIKKKAEAEKAARDALAQAQAELQELHNRYQFNPEQNSMDRRKEAKENLDLSKKLEREAGNVANNINEQLDSNTKVQVAFNDKLKQTDRTVQELTNNLKAEAKAMRDKAKVDAAAILNTAKAEAAMKGFSASVTTAGIEIVKLGRIIPTSLVDPFKQARAELGETGSRLADFGRMFGMYFSGRTVINYFRQAAESANAFGMEIRRIQSLATDFDFTNLRNELMDIDARFGNVIHNANALYWAYSSGVRGTEKELANFVEVMSKTSTTIKSDIMPTVDAATSIMNAWNLSAGSAAEIGDLLFSIIKYGKSNAQQLTTSLGHVVAPAAALNVNLDELGATIATLTKTMKTNRALTYLSNILGKMASPTKQVQEAAAEMGIELSATAIKARGFAQTLADIRRVTGGDIGKIAKLFPDLRGQRAAITLLSTQYKDFEQQLENMRDKAGAMEEALGKITDTPEAQLKAIRNTISMISIGAGDAVNTTITLGGLLGPILEKINKLEHGGRELLGHLTASVGATVGLAVASRALAAAQFGAAQAAYQMAAAANETHKVELSNALLAEKRLIDEKGLAVAALKRELSEKKNNDDLLRSLREQAIAMKDQSQQARQRLTDAKQTLNIEDQMLKRRMEDRAVAVGTSRTRLASLGEWLNDLQTGDAQKKLLADINLVKRLQADISISQATLSDEEAQLVGKYRNIIQPLVEQETEARKRMMEAMESGDVESFENQKSFLNYILQQIKTNTGISGQMAQYDTQGRLLEQETRRVMLAEMQKGLVAGQNYEHSLLIQFVEDEIKTEKTKLATLQSDLDVLKQNHATNDEIRTQLDAITKQTAIVNELDAKRLEIQTQIEQRERSLTGRGREQLQILSDIQKEAQQKLQLDTEDVENLQKNLDIEMRRASFIGGATLEATKASVAARMQEHNVVLQLNTLERERETLIDKEGNLINESAEAAERIAAIDKERVELQSKLVKLQQQYVELGIKAGSERARNMRVAGWNGELDGLVKSLARDKGVVKEAVKAMSAEVGKGIFGGSLGGRGMQGLAIASTMIPGLGRYGMGASMLASLGVFDKAASGITRLTAGTLRLFNSTEKLQKQGVMSLSKGVEDLTRSLMTSRLTLKGFKVSVDAIAASGKGQALAGAIAGKAGLAIGIGMLVGTLLYKGLKSYFTNHQGPFDEVFEKMLGVGDSKNYGDMLDMRIENMRHERQANEEMQRELRRMLKIQKERVTILEEQKTVVENMANMQEALHKLERIDGIEKIRNDIRSTTENLVNMQKDEQNWTSWWQELLFARRAYVANYDEIVNELQKSIPEERAKLEKLTGTLADSFKSLFLGAAEYRFQALNELLESDRTAAFTPALDENGKLGMAEKMVSMSVGRIASLLKLDDIAGQSTDQIREMIRQRMSHLTIANEAAQAKLINAQINLKDPKLIKDDKKFKEAEENVKKLEENANATKKELDDFESNIRASMSDFYTKVINRSEALVNKTLEQIKKDNKQVKVFNARTNFDSTLRVTSIHIEMIRNAIEKIEEDYRNGVGVFSQLNNTERKQVFQSQVDKLTDALHDQMISRVNILKGAMDSIANLVTSISNDAVSGNKSLFEFRMSNPLYTGMRPKLMKQRMQMLNQMLQGENGVYAQRMKAFETMNLRMDVRDYAGAAKALADAQAFGKTALGYEKEKYELIKRQADIQRSIGQSMYQLAATLQGQFSSTAQTAVDAYSQEAIRLQLRRIGENIAPAIDASAQVKEAQFYEQLMQKDRQFGQDLMMAGERLAQRVQEESRNARLNAEAAKTMTDAATKIDGAAHVFERTMSNPKPMFKVKRI